MNLLRIGKICFSFLLLSKICLAENAYWDKYEAEKTTGRVKNLVEHVQNLSNCPLDMAFDQKQEHANAIIYFITTGGKYGFRSTPANSDERIAIANSLRFSGKVLEALDFSQEYTAYKKASPSDANIVEHLKAAQAIFFQGQKPLFVYFHPLGQTGDFCQATIDEFIINASAYLGRTDITRSSFDLYAPTAQNNAWSGVEKFKEGLKKLASSESQYMLPEIVNLSFISQDIYELTSDLEKNGNIGKIATDVLNKMDHRPPSRVIMMGQSEGGIIAPFVMQHITNQLNQGRFKALITDSGPIVWQSNADTLPENIIMYMPDKPENIIINMSNNEVFFPYLLSNWSCRCIRNLATWPKLIAEVTQFTGTSHHLEASNDFKKVVATTLGKAIPLRA